MSTLITKHRVHATKICLAMTALFICAGCETGEEKVPDYGQVRIHNNWSEPVGLFFGETFVVRTAPGRADNAQALDGLHRVSIRSTSGKELFHQIVEIPDNTFADYTVQENGSVVATAGNIRVPDIVGNGSEEIRLDNTAAFPAALFVNGVELTTVAPLGNASVVIPTGLITVSIRKGRRTLFEQTLDVPRNTVIHYTVLTDGTVITTGGANEENTDIDEDRYELFGPNSIY